MSACICKCAQPIIFYTIYSLGQNDYSSNSVAKNSSTSMGQNGHSCIQYIYILYIYIYTYWASSDVANFLAILAKFFFSQIQITLVQFYYMHASRQQQTLMYSACFSTKMLVVKLAQMGYFCLAKSDAMWPMAQRATGSTRLDIYDHFSRNSHKWG